MNEFEFIRSLLAPLAAREKGALALTDDAAIVQVPQGQELVITKDAIVAGVHFIGDEPPGIIAQKALRVNLSDLAAMGAKPYAYFLALMLPPDADEPWLKSFAGGLRVDQETYGITLMGGDTTRMPGPLCLSITALGLVPAGGALLRSGAKPGDDIYVSGTVGDGALGLKAAKGELSLPPEAHDYLLERYRLPRPRLALGERLRAVASACIDISDGLVQDLGHICNRSAVGAQVHADAVPLSDATKLALPLIQNPWEPILTGGDDYELLFTAPREAADTLQLIAVEANTTVTRIGKISEGSGVSVLDKQGKAIALQRAGYTHF